MNVPPLRQTNGCGRFTFLECAPEPKAMSAALATEEERDVRMLPPLGEDTVLLQRPFPDDMLKIEMCGPQM
jgi:hypothetical protein